uniref:Reverse transcriptase domain-containing protein n=1 Tax=Rodentolepis nana TaxID=102285 RepID=A0A0R3TID9_RODNA
LIWLQPVTIVDSLHQKDFFLPLSLFLNPPELFAARLAVEVQPIS